MSAKRFGSDEREIRPRKFVAIDGEGLTRADGSHDYTLLAASDGSYVERYTLGGLGTQECLEYLLSVGREHKSTGRDLIMVGFFTSYDVNMLLRDCPKAVLERLWLGLSATWKPAHSVYQYRLDYVQNRILKVAKGFWFYDKDDKPKWFREEGIVWWDCFQFYQSSFVNALKEWNAAPKEVLDEIKAMKDKRGEFVGDERGRIRAYCFSECELLVQLMERVAETLDRLGLRLTSWYGAGSIASAMLNREGIKKHIRREWTEDEILDLRPATFRAIPLTAVNDEQPTKNSDLQSAIMSAYFGGRVETFAVGVIDTASWNYDVRSAYPAAITKLPDLRGSTWKRQAEYSYEIPHAIWRVRWAKIGDANVRFSPFPFRSNKRIYWPHSGEGWYFAEEVRAAFDVFGDGSRGIALEVAEGYVLRLAADAVPEPFAWYGALYKERAERKRAGDAVEKTLKLMLNSGYGKFAQSVGGREGKPPQFQCYTWAGMITAWCRATIMRAAATVPPMDLLAIATDGLFTKTEAALTMGEGLGDWERSAVEPGLMLIQPGVYATPSLGKDNKGRTDGLYGFAKTRGFSGQKLLYDELLSQWLLKGFEARVKIPDTRFIGLGYALATDTIAEHIPHPGNGACQTETENGLCPSHWRRWLDGAKWIGFSGTTSKYPDLSGSLTSRLQYLICPNTPPESPISAPYAKRGNSRVELVDSELVAASIAEQPDMEYNEFTWH